MMVLCTQVNKMYVIATLSVYPHRTSLKNMPGHGGIRTYDLWIIMSPKRTYDLSIIMLPKQWL